MNGRDVLDWLTGSLQFPVQVVACRPPHVPVPKPGPCRGSKRKPKVLTWRPLPSGGDDPRWKDAKRREAIQEASKRADLLLEVVEALTDADALGKAGDAEIVAWQRAMRAKMARLAATAGLGDDPQVERLARLSVDRDNAAADGLVKKLEKRFKFRRVGVTQEEVPFDPQRHKALLDNARPRTGQLVEVIDPGYDLEYKDELIRFRKPLVDVP